MDLATIQDKVIKSKLEEVFGANMGGMILNLAVGQSVSGKSDSEKLNLICEFICNNPKVVAVLGASEAKRQLDEWKKLL